MNKELLISIKPEHLANILNGKKTLELRKTVPKDYKGWVNIYCTKSSGGRTDMKRPYLFRSSHDNEFLKDCGADIYLISNLKPIRNILNGKVVARFWFDEYEEITLQPISKNSKVHVYQSEKISNYDLMLKTCLQEHEMVNYLEAENGYIWHIKQLEIFDKPKELSDYLVRKKDEYSKRNYYTYSEFSVERPPQSYQFVYVKE